MKKESKETQEITKYSYCCDCGSEGDPGNKVVTCHICGKRRMEWIRLCHLKKNC